MTCCCHCCFNVAVFFLIAAIIIKIYLKLTRGWNRSFSCLVGKTAIVTGANTGIGYYTALDFAQRGARVILACRNKAKTEKARSKIILASGNENVVVKIIDMASLKSVRDFASDINATEKRLDILVNNAGAIGLESILTEDGLELLMQVNHFGNFLLTNLLIGLLKKSTPSRIVNVSSNSSLYSRFSDIRDLNKLEGDGFLLHQKQYAKTKLCNVLFTNELAKRLSGTGITTNSVHPGPVYTKIFKPLPKLFNVLVDNVAIHFFKTWEEGAQTSIYVAVSKDVKDISGEYFSDCKVAKMAKEGRNLVLMKQVWERSEKFVKLTPHEIRSNWRLT